MRQYNSSPEILETEMSKTNKNIHDEFNLNNIIVDNYKYIDYSVKSVILKSTVYDIKHLINEKAKMREGFNINAEEKTISIPNFFAKLNGVLEDKKEQKDLITLLEKDAFIIHDFEVSEKSLDKLLSRRKSDIRKLLDKNTIDSNIINEIISLLPNLSAYKKFRENNIKSINSYQYKYVLDKLDDFIFKYKMNTNFSRYEDYYKLILNIIFMPKEIIDLLNNWDYSSFVPKIIIYDETNKSTPSNVDYLITDFYNYLGLDIVIVSPTGKSNIETFNFSLNEEYLSNIVLDKFEEPKQKTRKEIEKRNKNIKKLFVAIISVFLSIVVFNTSKQIVNKIEINNTIKTIESIKNITIDSKDEIEKAYEKYNSLDEEQKEEIYNYHKLKEAKEEYQNIVKKDMSEDIKDVEKAIRKLESSNFDLNNEKNIELIKNARSLYDSLPEEAQSEVSNYKILEKAEENLNSSNVFDSFSDKLVSKMISFSSLFIVFHAITLGSIRIFRKNY